MLRFFSDPRKANGAIVGPLDLDAGIGFLTLYPLLAFAAVLALVPLARKHAKSLGFLDDPDAPGGRKTHESRVPPVGGLVVVPVALFVTLVALWPPTGIWWALVAGCAILLAAGAWDDARNLAPWLKFALQIAAACLIVFTGDSRIENLGNLFGFGSVGLGMWSAPFTIFCVVLLVNAVNMIDGLDGLAGGVVIGALFWFAFVCVAYGDTLPAGIVGVWIAAVAGFLVYNLRSPWRRRASVFLGDSGSMALGLFLAWLAIGFSQSGTPEPMIRPIVVAWVLTVPVMDAFALFVGRTLRGRHPFSADRRHLHHRFVDAGYDPARVSAWIVAASFACGAFGYGASRAGAPEWVLTALWTFVVLGNAAVQARHQAFVDFLKARRSGASR